MIYIDYINKVQLQKSLIFVVVGWVINSETTLEHVIYPNVFLKRIEYFLDWSSHFFMGEEWVWPYLVEHLKHMFLVFKQYYTYFYTLFHSHVF